MDYYQTIGVPRSASTDEIKKAYKKLAAKYHPDRNPGDATAVEKFKEVQTIYDVLSDANKKFRYDNLGYATSRPTSSRPPPKHPYSKAPPKPPSPPKPKPKPRPRNLTAKEIDDIEEKLKVDGNIVIRMKLTQQEMDSGGNRIMSYEKRDIVCVDCKAKGKIYTTCRKCNGDKQRPSWCEKCDISGKTMENCEICDGAGVHTPKMCYRQVYWPANCHIGFQITAMDEGEMTPNEKIGRLIFLVV